MGEWMDGWMDGLECVYKQFGMVTLDEPIICQRLSECERKGNMDGKWWCSGSSLLLRSRATKHDEKCCCGCVFVCVRA